MFTVTQNPSVLREEMTFLGGRIGREKKRILVWEISGFVLNDILFMYLFMKVLHVITYH